ncbi:MAG: hypothetical protein HYR91_01630 [Flavobacteriia bacterium]|nr:hypothetical protein [Flavobacteriia bacterium]
MKNYNFKLILFFTIICFSFCLSSCGTTKEEENVADNGLNIDDDYYEFQGFNLKDFDIPAMIMLPDETADIGASTKPEVIHSEDDFKWEVIVGQNFHLLIDDWGDYTDMVVSRKKELKELEFYKIKYLIDEKDFILYEQVLKVDGSAKASSTVGIPHKSYHVYAQKVIDGVTYVFRSRDEGYEKQIIELIAKSIKSVKSLKTA